MGNKFLDSLRTDASFAFGLIDDMVNLYVRPLNSCGEVSVIHNSNVNRYWTKDEFDINKAVISICITDEDNTPYVDVGTVRIFNILVTDIIGVCTGKYSQTLRYNSVDVTYNKIMKAFRWSADGLTVQEYAEFLKGVVENFSAVSEYGFSELSGIAKESFEGLDVNNLKVTTNVLNSIAKGVYSFDGLYLPSVTLKATNRKEKRALLERVCIETRFTSVPIVHLLELKENYIELGSLIATQWVNDCVNIHTAEEALLTTRELVFYVSCILVDMFLSFSVGVNSLK